MNYAVRCKGGGRCDCCPGSDNPQLCDDLGLRLLKEVCIGFDTCEDGVVFPYPYNCLYYGSRGCAMVCLDRGARLPISLLLAFLIAEEPAIPWWDEEAHAACLVARLSPATIEQLRGRIRADYDFTLALLPTYPIIRTRLCFRPDRGALVVVDAVFDVGAREHVRVLAHLTAQDTFHVHLHQDDTLGHVYSKLCPLAPSNQDQLQAMLVEARRWLLGIPEDVRNFQRAKHDFRTVTET
jgi:hypothetical protein